MIADGSNFKNSFELVSNKRTTRDDSTEEPLETFESKGLEAQTNSIFDCESSPAICMQTFAILFGTPPRSLLIEFSDQRRIHEFAEFSKRSPKFGVQTLQSKGKPHLMQNPETLRSEILEDSHKFTFRWNVPKLAGIFRSSKEMRKIC